VVLVVSDVHHAMDNCAKLHDWLQQNPRKYAAANALPRVQCAVARPRDSLPFTWPIVLVARTLALDDRVDVVLNAGDSANLPSGEGDNPLEVAKAAAELSDVLNALERTFPSQPLYFIGGNVRNGTKLTPA